jgi:hypothetical protein
LGYLFHSVVCQRDRIPAADGIRPVENSICISRPAVTVRSVLSGAALVVLVSALTPFAEYRLHSVELFQGELPLGALASLVIVILPIQWLLGRFAPRWRFSEAEILFMFVMAFAGIMVYHIGMMGLFLSIISSPDYFASSENRYTEYLLPYLPRWAIVPNDHFEMTWFYTGLPAGERLPWQVWWGPLFWWWSFFLAFLVLCGALTAILRKQWFDYEKIRFPQAEVPLALVEGAGGEKGRPQITKSSPLWAGFILAGGVLVWNVGNYFYPIWPRLDISQMAPLVLNLGPKIDSLAFVPDPLVIGISYLVDTKVLFSVWFFRLFALVQRALQVQTGYVSAQTDMWTTSDNLSGWQSLGGLFFIVFWGVWMSRAHLRTVWRHALHPERSPDTDSNELVSYRLSLILLFACSVYIVMWLCHLGLTLPVATVFFLVLVVLVVGVTRIVAETGMPLVGAPVTAQGITMRLFGDTGLGASNIAGLAVTYAAFRMIEGYPMPMTMHAARLGDAKSTPRRALFLAILLGSAAAMVVMSITTLCWPMMEVPSTSVLIIPSTRCTKHTTT